VPDAANANAPARERAGLAILSVAIVLLQGCAASTQLIQNDKASDEIKARSFKSYKEVLLIPPSQDPRNVVPRTVSAIEGMGFKVRLLDPSKPIDAAQGTGFLIGADGYVLTCAHVIGDATETTVTVEGKRHFADVVKSDKEVDLALLRLRDKLPEPVVTVGFRGAAHAYSMGDDVFTIGYPLSRLLGNGERMTKGVVSATSGMRDDAKHLQISAEVQPGNSGGPLLDHEGNVIGVVQQTINPWRVASASGGALPQNINFSLKNEPVLDFIKGASQPAFDALAYDKGGGLEAAGRAVVKIQAGIVESDSDGHDKMVVRLNYISIWDIWYRFRLFVLTAFDYETQEPLFAVGQGRDNLVSNEDVVMSDTFGQFRKAVESR
jgi:S1-C subfamily serine protease